MESLPDTVQNAVRFIVENLNPGSVILFGSRARGDHRPTSDVDLAVCGVGKPENWSEVVVRLEGEPFTLFKIDLLDYGGLSESFRHNVDREGVVLFGGHAQKL